MTLSSILIAVIAGSLGAYAGWRRVRTLTGIVPASRLQKELGLYAENRPEIRLDPARVPADLRNLIPLAEKWGVGDDIIRNDMIGKASAAEKQELHEALYATDERVTEWLSTFSSGEMSDEAEAFMYMQGTLDEMGIFLKVEKSGQPQPAVEVPRHIGEKVVRAIPAALFEKLNRVTPSRNGDMVYYPCRVTMRDGRVFDRVYVQSREPYQTHWGKLPFDDHHKGWIAISEIVDLEESPLRIPPALAEEIYRKGGTSVGVHMFRVTFRQGMNRVVMTGKAVDFVPLPEGVTGADAVWAQPVTGYDESSELGPRYHWSIYEGIQ